MLPYLRYKKHKPVESMLISSAYDPKILFNTRLFLMRIESETYLIDRYGVKVADVLVMDDPDNEQLFSNNVYVITEKKMGRKHKKKAGIKYPVYYANAYIYGQRREKSR